MKNSLFLKYIKSYLGILGISMLILLPVYIVVFKSMESRVVNSANINLEKSVNELDDYVTKVGLALDMLTKNEWINYVMDIDGDAQAIDTYAIQKAQEVLSNSLVLSMEEFDERFLFRNNNIVMNIGGVIANKYLQGYKSVGQTGMDYKDLHQWVFESERHVNYAPLIQGDNSSGIICAVKLNEGIKRFANIACVFEVNDKQLSEYVGIADESVYFLCITDIKGDVLYQKNCSQKIINQLAEVSDASTVNSEISDYRRIRGEEESYILLQVYAEDSGMYWKMGISKQEINNQIVWLNRLMIIYFIGAILGIALLCIFCAWKGSWRMSSIVTEMEMLKKDIRESMVLKLLLCGIYSQKEKEDFRRFLNWEMDFYCVVCISIEQEEKYAKSFLYIDELMHKLFQCIGVPIDKREKAYIVRMTGNCESDEADVSNKLEKLFEIYPELLIGISEIGTQIENVQLRYRQAKLMNRQATVEFGVHIKKYLNQMDKKDKIYKMNLGNQLYDLIYAAEKDSIKRVFDKIRSYVVMNNWDTEAEMMQFFFEIQNPIAKVYDEMQPSDSQGINRLYFQAGKPIMELINSLEEISLYLSDYIRIKNATENRKRWKYDFEQFVEAHYADKNMSVYYAASHMNLSEKYFAVLFKEQVGQNFSSYVESRRMQQVEKLLVETKSSMAEIADAVGFSTLDAFYKSFKKIYGVAPGKWREMKRNREDCL